MNIRALVVVVGLAAALRGQGSLKLEDLPAPVQETVRAETKNAKLAALSKETEKGKVVYRVETKVGNSTRELVVNPAGKVTAVEEEISINAVPAAAREIIEKRAAGGQIKRVEMVMAPGEVAPFYQAMIETKGKSSEVAVNANGSRHK